VIGSLFFATGVEEAAHESMITIRELLAILDQWRIEVARLGLRSDSAKNRLPELLIANPVVTVNQVKEVLVISFPTANAALAKLKEMGILVQTDRQRNRIFIAQEVITLLKRPTENFKDKVRKKREMDAVLVKNE
jgi:Fic family protein